MASRELGMVELREILRRWMAGEGLRAIARNTGMDRKTVAEHVRAATAIGLQRGGPPPTDEQVAVVLSQRRPGRPPTAAAPSPEGAALWPSQERIQRWLKGDALRLTKIHRRLRAEGLGVSTSTLSRFARAHCDVRPAVLTVRVADPPPGEVAEADCGLLGLWTDSATAQRRRIWGLLVTLCDSRSAFLAVSVRQDLPAVLDGLDAAWAFFAGVVRRLVIDTLTPAVRRADRSAPVLERVFLEYAQFRGFVVDPTVVRHPTGTPRVERGIPDARQDFFRGERVRDLADMQTRALLWCRDLAGTRVHGTPRQVPRGVFETVEHAALLPVAPAPFDRPTWAQCTVHPDHHIQFRRALYSVPTRYVGQEVDVRRVETILRPALERSPSTEAGGQVVPLPARCARAPERVAHRPLTKEDEHGDHT